MILKQLLATLGVAILTVTGSVQADSVKLVNPTNNNSYQRFDTAMIWDDAKAACTSLSAHLATVTSKSEQDWIQNNLTSETSYAWLGGTDVGNEGTWIWITGEKWSYANWHSGEPNNGNGGVSQNYLAIAEVDWLGQWDDGWGDTLASYICEWESSPDPSQYLDVTGIPDVNGDGVSDQVVLVKKLSNYYLRTINGATGKKLKQVVLKGMPEALTVAGTQISVLITKSTGVSVLELRDNTTLTIVKTLKLPK